MTLTPFFVCSKEEHATLMIIEGEQQQQHCNNETMLFSPLETDEEKVVRSAEGA